MLLLLHHTIFTLGGLISVFYIFFTLNNGNVATNFHQLYCWWYNWGGKVSAFAYNPVAGATHYCTNPNPGFGRTLLFYSNRRTTIGRIVSPWTLRMMHTESQLCVCVHVCFIAEGCFLSSLRKRYNAYLVRYKYICTQYTASVVKKTGYK